MKFGKRLMSMALALVMIFGLTVSASAAVAQNVTAKLSPDITVEAGGKTQAMADANGSPVYPVLYNGTTYLPVRAISNLLRLDVDWDQATRTVLLSDFNGTTPPAGTSNTPASAKPADIAVQIDPSVTVQYKGETQKMTDANGSPVYPMLYNGTTYVPIRAIGNMLGLGIDWNQDTRTVTLVQLPSRSSGKEYYADEDGYYYYTGGIRVTHDQIILKHDNGEVETFSPGELGAAYAAIRNMGHTSERAIEAIQVLINVRSITPPTYTSPFSNISTTSDIDSKFISGTCVARDWAELDWTHANDGYVTVRVNELTGPNTRVSVSVRYSDGTCYAESDTGCILAQGEWRIPLRGGSTEYVIELKHGFHACSHMLTEAERTAMNERKADTLVAKFDAEISNPETIWTVSTPYANYENAPKTQAKAKELTKNCKIDAEKVATIFNWIADNVKYDDNLWASVQAYDNATGKTCMSDPNGRHNTPAPYCATDYYDLDKILTNKSGICVHYAALTVGMLRSIGIPCRVVNGEAYDGSKWENHAWVEISPNVTGLNKTTLGGGTGKDGWTRIDPTYAATGGSAGRSAAAIDDNYKALSIDF